MLAQSDLAPADSVSSLVVLPDASVVLGGVAPSVTNFGGPELDSSLSSGPFVAAFSAQGQLRRLELGGGKLRGLLTFKGQLELGTHQLSDGASVLLDLRSTDAAAGGAGPVD